MIKKVSRETLTHLVDVARMSPSGCNSAAMAFIIVDEPRHMPSSGGAG
ncbi:MAG: hypothetical protein ACLVJO_12155 [[Clostridium] scindens]